MTDQTHELKQGPRKAASRQARAASRLDAPKVNAALCWPFPAGSQNNTDAAVKLKPYVPPKRRTLNQY